MKDEPSEALLEDTLNWLQRTQEALLFQQASAARSEIPQENHFHLKIAETACVIGVYVTGEIITAALADAEGKPRARLQCSFSPLLSPEIAGQKILSLTQALLREHDGRLHLRAVVAAISEEALSNRRSAPLAAWLSKNLGAPVRFLAEGQAVLFAEAKIGAGKGLAALLYFSPLGVNHCALLLGNSIYEVNLAGLEQYPAGDGPPFESLKEKLTQGGAISLFETQASLTPQLFWNMVEAGDALAQAMARESALPVAAALAQLIETFNLQALIISAPAAAEELWREAIKDTRSEERCLLLQAKLGKDAPLLGALLLAQRFGKTAH